LNLSAKWLCRIAEPTFSVDANDLAAAAANFNGDTTPNSTQLPKLNGLTVDQAIQRVHLAIRSLLTDEFPDLAKRRVKDVDEGCSVYSSRRLDVQSFPW
jgi:hypothetical protein